MKKTLLAVAMLGACALWAEDGYLESSGGTGINSRYFFNPKSRIEVDFATAFLLSLVSTVSACGASGVAGGSLLLIPLACSMFGISNDVAMQVVGIGFIIGVIQDSCETALNSSSDVLFTAAAEFYHRRKAGK